MDAVFRVGLNILAFGGDTHSEEGGHTAGAAAHHGASYEGLMFYVALVLIIIFAIMTIAKKGLSTRVFKNRPAHLLEHLYLFIQNMCVGIIGPHGKKYVPMMMVFWMVIFTSNIISLFFPTAPTADLSFNLAMALCAVGYVQWEGMRSNGVAGHFSHFAGPKLGGLMVLISGMIFVIELISEFMKNVSLSLRLYGNIEGGHQAVVEMNKVGDAIFLPVGAFLLPIKLLTCLVQALVFTLLTSVYISLVTHHDHGDEHAGGEAHAH